MKHRFGRSKKPIDIFSWIMLLLSVSLAILIWHNKPREQAPDHWMIIACNVGQGSATLLRNNTDSAILVDTGEANSGLEDCLQWSGIDHLDQIYLSHDHSDHVGNLRTAEEWLRAAPNSPGLVCGPAAERICESSRAETTQTSVMSQGQSFESQHIVLTSLWPPNSAHISEDQQNNASLILYAQIAGANGEELSALLPADAETETLHQILHSTELPNTPIDVLLVPHHGSKTSGTEFLQAISSPISIISAGIDNEYGHPHQEILTQLNKQQTHLEQTQESGNIAVTSHDNHLVIESQR